MKTLVFVLVLANLLFYALSSGLLGRADNPDSQRLEQQIQPERLHIVGRGEQPAPPPAVSFSQRRQLFLAVSVGGGASLAGDAEQVAALLQEKFPAFQQNRQTASSEGSGWWVFVPPLASRADAEKKAAEFRHLGISDYFITQEAGPNRNAISLGIFSTEKGARERLAEVRAKGVRSAQIATRPGKENLVNLEASGPLDQQASLRAATSELLPRQAPRDCP